MTLHTPAKLICASYGHCTTSFRADHNVDLKDREPDFWTGCDLYKSPNFRLLFKLEPLLDPWIQGDLFALGRIRPPPQRTRFTSNTSCFPCLILPFFRLPPPLRQRCQKITSNWACFITIYGIYTIYECIVGLSLQSHLGPSTNGNRRSGRVGCMARA